MKSHRKPSISHQLTLSIIAVILFTQCILINHFTTAQSNNCNCDYCNCGGGFSCTIKPGKYNLAPGRCDYAPNTYVSYMEVKLQSSSDLINVRTFKESDYDSGSTSVGISGLSSSGAVSCFQGSSFMTDTSVGRYVATFQCSSSFSSCSSSKFDLLSYCTDYSKTVNNVLLQSDKMSVKSGDVINFKTYLRDATNTTISTKASVTLNVESAISPFGFYNIDAFRAYFSEEGVGDFSGAVLKSKIDQNITLIAKYVQGSKFLESRVSINVIGDPTFNNSSKLNCGILTIVLILIISLIAF